MFDNKDNDRLKSQIDKNVVFYQSTDFTVESYIHNLKNGELIIPDYQRDFEWSEDKQSRFIESLLINLPAPSVFLIENEEGQIEISDGSQRIRTLSNFINGGLELNGLKILTELNKRTYDDLPLRLQRKIKTVPVKGYVFINTDRKTQLEIFRRVNTQSIARLPDNYK